MEYRVRIVNPIRTGIRDWGAYGIARQGARVYDENGFEPSRHGETWTHLESTALGRRLHCSR
jgi:hypothetical protein